MDKDEIYAPFLPQGDTLDPDLQKGLLGYDETDQQLRPQMPFQQHRASPPLHPPIIADLFCSWDFWELVLNCKKVVDLHFYSYPPTFPFQSLHPIPQQQAPVNLQLPQSSVRPPSTVPANLPAVPATPGPPNRLMIPLRTGRNTLSFKTLPFENEKKEFYLNVS
uniref:Uncharacterized protein n=1 Tax=Panagrolaimus davidi TaxID=227884 RepID=A0A914QAU3_9BILA